MIHPRDLGNWGSLVPMNESVSWRIWTVIINKSLDGKQYQEVRSKDIVEYPGRSLVDGRSSDEAFAIRGKCLPQ